MKLENGHSEIDQFCHSCGELYDENDRFCVKCGDKRKSTLDSEGDKDLRKVKGQNV